MTSATTGLPDRYRALDQIGPDESTATGVLRCWRAKDRVLNRDVAIRVHVPGGEAARGWISRALTAGGLATPALAMVYDAAEGSGEHDAAGGAAYVVNEWIEGETLAERVERGPVPEREARTLVRRLAEGVAEAHRVGLAVGGITPENVVLRPGGLVGLRAVPAASGTMAGDIADLGAVLELCLTGRPPGDGSAAEGDADGAGDGPAIASPDLAALVRRARSAEPSSGLASVAAMAALLAERPRTGTTGPLDPVAEGRGEDPGRRRRRRDRRPLPVDGAPDSAPDAEEAPDAGSSGTGDATRALSAGRPGAAAGRAHDSAAAPTSAVALPATSAVPALPPARSGDRRGLPDAAGFDDDDLFPRSDDPAHDDEPSGSARRRLAVVGLPLLALALVVGGGWWFGSNVLSVAGSVSEPRGSTPSATRSSAAAPSPAASSAGSSAPVPTGGPLAIASATVFDPYGDGEPENDRQVRLSYDGDPTTAWKTLDYRSTPVFGGLKPGVGVLYDLGSDRALGGVTLTTTRPGSAVEVRVGETPVGTLDSYRVVASSASLPASTSLSVSSPVTGRYVLVWVTSLVPDAGRYAADLAEVGFTGAG